MLDALHRISCLPGVQFASVSCEKETVSVRIEGNNLDEREDINAELNFIETQMEENWYQFEQDVTLLCARVLLFTKD